MSARNVRFEPSGPLRGSYTPPADKSISHRAALFGAMADEPVTVRNLLDSAGHPLHPRRAAEARRRRGGGPRRRGGEGVGLHAPLEATGGLLDVGNSGTLMRLLPGWLAGQPGGVWTLDGDESIRRRPIDRVAEPLGAMGAQVEAREGRFAPFTVRGSRLKGIDYELPVASAQVKSCVLIAGMLAAGTTTITEPAPEPRPHRAHAAPRARAVRARRLTHRACRAVDELELEEIVVPGDPSSAAFMVAAATLVSGSRVVLSQRGPQLDPHGLLPHRGAHGRGDPGRPRGAGRRGRDEPVGELDVASSSLEGTVIEPHEVPLAIDELTLVALLGAFAEGETVLRGAEELRLKESDRIAAVVGGLRGIGRGHRGDRGRLRGPRRRLAAARAGRSTRSATTAWRCSARWPASPRRTASRCWAWTPRRVSYPGFERDLRSLLGDG